MGTVATGKNQSIRINIDKWSSPEQRQLLIQTFQEKKQDGLLRELEKQPELGRFNFPGYMGPDPNSVMRLGTDIRYAMSFPGADGGRRIVVMASLTVGPYASFTSIWTDTRRPFSMRSALLKRAQYRRESRCVSSWETVTS